ncbi:MAG TPA: OmpA family protein [Gallionella sp.]|nr:OmpA family protein [Gallionella sp.]
MNKKLIATLISGMLTGMSAQADDAAKRCEDAYCTLPSAPGNSLMRSRVLTREGGKTPPNAEYRQPNEVARISSAMVGAAPEASGLDEKNVAEFEPHTERMVAVGHESGLSLLKPDERRALQALAERLAGKPNLRLSIVGHADEQRLTPRARARYKDNQGLSEARAAEAAAFLHGLPGFADVPIATAGHGDSEPMAQCDAKQPMLEYQSCLAPNRRVEIQIWYDAVSERVERVARPAAPIPVASAGCAQSVAVDSGLPFRVTIDGEPMVAADKLNTADVTRCVDVALSRADVQVKFDSLALNPELNVWTYPVRPKIGQSIEFLGYTNYAPWVRRAEVRVFVPGQNAKESPLAVLPLAWAKATHWQAPEGGREYAYLLRVYDAEGHFDETTLKTVAFSEHGGQDMDVAKRERNVGYGENALGLRNIPVSGGTVTVSGVHLPAGSRAHAFGLEAPVDADGKFAIRQIMPTGPHTVRVELEDAAGKRSGFERNLALPKDDWFYIALADLTAGRNSATSQARVVTNDTYHYENRAYIDGRGAFYLKGKIKGEWLLTAAADTREQPLRNLFSNFASKDPRYLLRNIDPDAYYPVYGDDSTTVDDAPTQGKFFVKLQRGDSHVMWGNFQTQWNGSELIQYSRGLYGANLHWRSEAATGYGERQTGLDAFVAQPGTAASRDEFRGTGGSLYYLRHQDITQGSERVWVEVRDKDSGLVIERKQLAPAQDYEVNYLQGRITLREPLAATASGGGLVQTAALNGHALHLVASYEYVPGLNALSGAVTGAHANHWVNDHVQLGATTYHQGETGSSQTMGSLDATLRYKPGTWVKAETAGSVGAGTASMSSLDGGFGFNSLSADGRRADAQRIDAAVDMKEVVEDGKGKMSAYAQHRGLGYSGPGQIAALNESVSQQGVRLDMPLGKNNEMSLKADGKQADTQDADNVELSLASKVSEQWKLSGGVRHDKRNTRTANLSNLLSANGKRTDAVVRADYMPQDENGQAEDWSVYGYAQGTLARDVQRAGNNRGGLGATWRITEALKTTAEGSAGNGGPGMKLTGDYQFTDRSNAYLTWLVENESPDSAYRGRQSSVVTGSNYQVSDNANFFTEARRTGGAGQESLTKAFGLDLAPNERWNTGAKLELGTVSDPLAGDLKRRAMGLSVGYKLDKTKYTGNLEYREETGRASNRTTWLLRNTLGYQATPDWRLMAKGNLSVSGNSQGAFFDGDYREVVLAAAYRPVDNDRWNTLFKYTNFYNLPSPGQLASSGASADYAQKSQVLAVDAIYDVKPWLSLGGQYAMRFGELKDGKANGMWFSSRADLTVLRADFHWVHEWDAVVEGRRLAAREAMDAKSGALLAVYRHVDENVKIGLGYNFTDFSDDLTNLSYRSRGWFVNLLVTR